MNKTGEAETSSRRVETVDLVWKDLNFFVPESVKVGKGKEMNESDNNGDNVDNDDKKTATTSSSQRIVLENISGYVRAGTMLAVMGSSGAGKTSLLNLLAGRITSSRGANASGEVLVNGEPRDYNLFKKLAAYVLQDDDMFAELTVEEQLRYAALLRLPASMAREKKLIRVQRVIQELGLNKVKNTMVGNTLVRGISGGERKRLNIGTELVTDPALLFLDEPTTGLDSFNALNVMSSLRHLASNGRTIVSTIHQPRSSIFALFDQLCLLSEGRVMYFGPACDAVAYFAALDFHSPTHFNPADFFLDLLSVDRRTAERESVTKARVEYLGNKYCQHLPLIESQGGVGGRGDVEAGSNGQNGDGDLVDDSHVQLKQRDYQTSWINEFSVLCNRSVKLAFRERAANIARLMQVIFFAILLGLIWLNNARTNDSSILRSIPGILFFIVINQAFGGVFAVIFGFPLERSVVTRERAANTYRTSSYFLSKTFTDMPKAFFFNILFTLILYWMVGLRSTAGAFFTFAFIVFLTSFLAESLALAISILTGDAQAAAAVIPVFVIMALLFGGFFINSEQLDKWISWAKYLSFVFYAFNALVKNEFNDGSQFSEELLSDGQYNDLSIWENAAALIGILIVFRLMGYLFLQYFQAPKFLKF